MKSLTEQNRIQEAEVNYNSGKNQSEHRSLAQSQVESLKRFVEFLNNLLTAFMDRVVEFL